MKKTIILMFLLVTLIYANAQNKCKLIDSTTFSVPNKSKITQSATLNVTNNSIDIDTGRWVYIAYTKNSNNVSKIYIDGELITTGSYLNLSYTWSRIDIGAGFFTSYNGWFKGLIDELRVSNIERTSAEIKAYFNSASQFSQDNNTIGLYHFNENSGTTTNGVIGGSGSIFNAQWATGKFGSCLSYNGTNSRTQINLAIPTVSNTIEFWVFIPNTQNSVILFSSYGMNTNNFALYKMVSNVNYQWSTGAIGNSININPQNFKYIWVSDGNCYDTIWMDSESKNVYDTIVTSTTDTLYIKVNTSSLSNPIYNTVKVYPNPSSTQIVIDNGNYSSMGSYTAKIVNALGQQVFQSVINQQQFVIDVSTMGGAGVYTLSITDGNNNVVGIKKIVLQ